MTLRARVLGTVVLAGPTLISLTLISLMLFSLTLTTYAHAADLAEQSRLAGQRLRQTEDRLAAAWDMFDTLTARRVAAAQGQAAAEAALAGLVPAMLRLSRLPPIAVLTAQALPAETLRGYAVLRALPRHTAAIAAAQAAAAAAAAAQEQALATTLTRLEQLARVQQDEAAAMDRALDQARAERESQRDAAEAQAAAAARRHAADAARTSSMRAAVTAVARPVPSHAGPTSFVLPVAGPAIRHWGEPTEAGPANGLTFQPPPGARVVAPCAGRVVFAGPFRSYGLLLILDCGAGIHAVLAGFDRLSATVGLVVPADESVGAMATGSPNTRLRATLYVEVRRRGQPVDPGPFLGGRL